VAGGAWIAALAVIYGAALIGRGQRWHISPAHFTERYGLIVIVALGESIISIGVGASDVRLTFGPVTAAILRHRRDRRALVGVLRRDGAPRAPDVLADERRDAARLARDLYSYLHLPMIAGIVLLALGLEETIRHVGEPLATIPAVALCGGLSLYFLAHVAQRVRLVRFIRRTTTDRPGYIGPGRLATGVAMLAAIPAALEIPALASLALVAAVCCAFFASWNGRRSGCARGGRGRRVPSFRPTHEHDDRRSPGGSTGGRRRSGMGSRVRSLQRSRRLRPAGP